MSAPRKPRRDPGGNAPAMSRLKMLPATDREEIHRLCLSDKPLQEVRGEIHERYGISLSSDSQLSRFKDWQYHQQRTERLNSTLENFEEWYGKQNPEATREVIRERAMALFMSEAAASGDRKGFLEVLDRDQAERHGQSRGQIEREKLNVARTRLAQQSCELFVKWYADKKAQEIMGSGLSNAAKIAKLRETYFADVDELDQSGQVKIPD